jgi:cation transport regulator ChaC
LTELDHREQGGYERHTVELHLRDGRGSVVDALTYVAGAGNPHDLGHAPLEVMALQMERAHGPSGANRDYVLNLHEALVKMDVEDPHVSELMARLVGAREP